MTIDRSILESLPIHPNEGGPQEEWRAYIENPYVVEGPTIPDFVHPSTPIIRAVLLERSYGKWIRDPFTEMDKAHLGQENGNLVSAPFEALMENFTILGRRNDKEFRDLVFYGER